MTQSLYIAQDPNPIIILDFSFPLTSNPSANPINFMNIYPHTYIHHTFIHTYTYTYIYVCVCVCMYPECVYFSLFHCFPLSTNNYSLKLELLK